MKREIKVVGIEHKTGVKKGTTEAYDFYVMHGIYPNGDTEGYATMSVIVPDSEVSRLKVDETYTVFTHYWNGRESLDAIL